MKIRYLFFSLFVVLAVSNAISDGLPALSMIGSMLVLSSVMYLIHRVERGSQDNIGLTKEERAYVIVTEFFNPVLAGAFYYYCWKKSFPVKARQANKLSWIVLGIQLLLVVMSAALFHFFASRYISR